MQVHLNSAMNPAMTKLQKPSSAEQTPGKDFSVHAPEKTPEELMSMSFDGLNDSSSAEDYLALKETIGGVS